jgi:large subunit ribosomal protein L25
MQRITLNAEVREKAGKGAARSMRRAGGVPAVVYRAGESMPLKLDAGETMHFLRATSGEQVIVNLKMPDGKEKLALLKEYQRNPVRGDLLHMDFQEVSLTEKVKVTVHVSTVGEPVGVKRDGGVLQSILREIEVECLPEKIPGHIELDVSGLAAGQSIHVSDISLHEDVKIMTSPSEPIATVTIPTVAVEEEEEAAEEEAAAEEEVSPEVVRKGKKEEEETSAAEKKGKD